MIYGRHGIEFNCQTLFMVVTQHNKAWTVSAWHQAGSVFGSSRANQAPLQATKTAGSINAVEASGTTGMTDLWNWVWMEHCGQSIGQAAWRCMSVSLW